MDKLLCDSTSLEYEKILYGWHWHLITWVCGFSIKDSVHLDCFLRRRKRQLQEQPRRPPRRQDQPSSQPEILMPAFLTFLYSTGPTVLYAENTAVSKAGVVIVCEICNQVGAVAVDKEVLQYRVTGLWTCRGRGCPWGCRWAWQDS